MTAKSLDKGLVCQVMLICTVQTFEKSAIYLCQTVSNLVAINMTLSRHFIEKQVRINAFSSR